MSRAFLGIGIGCARCHDHKYDPITREDYRWVAAHFQTSVAQELFVGVGNAGKTAIDRLTRFDDEIRPALVDHVSRELAERVQRLPPLWLAVRDGSGQATPTIESAIALRWKSYLRNVVAHEPQNLFAGLWLAHGGFQAARAPVANEQAIAVVLRRNQSFAASMARAELYANFDGGSFGEWSTMGEAFANGPTRRSHAVLQSDGQWPIRSVAPAGIAHSAVTSAKLAGTLRSPQFIIRQPYIWCRAGGNGARLELIVDGLRRLGPPLYRGLDIELSIAD